MYFNLKGDKIMKRNPVIRIVIMLLALCMMAGACLPGIGTAAVTPMYSFDDDPPAGLRVGDYVFFGSYEQDNLSSQKEDIEWLVLDIRDDKALILSRYILDAIPYNSKLKSITWEDCTLRQWLNSTFKNTAFTSAQQRSIVSATIQNGRNEEYNIPGGASTRDQIFLLSYDDATSYFWGNSERQTVGTDYARAHGVYVDDESSCSWWWLRSPGKTADRAGNVVSRGIPSTYGGFVNSGEGGVRPALWVQTDAVKTYASNPYNGPKSSSYGIVTVGSVITFGHYEQDDRFSDGKEPIQWLVLDVQDDKALLISKYILDAQAYHEPYEDTTWATCKLRTWLNSTFLNTAFTPQEQSQIAYTTVSTADNLDYGTRGGASTQDQIFILSVWEAAQYFSTNISRRASTTDYILNNRVIYPEDDTETAEGELACWWRLRDPGMTQGHVARVMGDGRIYTMGDICNYVNGGIRPVLWLDLN